MPLAVCATPIGNLGDVTLARARGAPCSRARALRGHAAHAAAARPARDRGARSPPTTATTRPSGSPRCCRACSRGSPVALVSDAGLPGDLRSRSRCSCGPPSHAGVPVTVLPGPSAVETALVGERARLRPVRVRRLSAPARRPSWPRSGDELARLAMAGGRVRVAEAPPGLAALAGVGFAPARDRRLPRADQAVRGGRARSGAPSSPPVSRRRPRAR